MGRLFGDVCGAVEDPFLRRACHLAEQGRGSTSPNPLVGCVLVRDGRVVGEGWHRRSGLPHAEVEALRAAGSLSMGSTAYVTLEPCSHFGKTPPCTEALIAAGVSRVVIGLADPNPKAAGGADRLRAEGIEVVFAADPSPFEEQLAEWLTFIRTGLPFVRVKIAATLDGRPGLAPGTRSRLTGDAARGLTMRLRSAADAVAVGAGTIRVDDPSLLVTDERGRVAPRQPLRVVLSRSGAVPADAVMFRDGLGDVAILLPEGSGMDRSAVEAVRVIRYAGSGIRGALRALASQRVVSLLVEAGPTLLGALVTADVVDELVLLHAGGFAGDRAPAMLVGESQADTTVLDRRFSAVEAGIVGGDAATVWRPFRKAAVEPKSVQSDRGKE